MFSVYIATGHVEGSTQLKPFLLLFFVCSHRDGMRLIEKNVYLYLKRQWAWLRPISILVTKSNNIPKMWAERQILDSGSCENLSGFPRKKNYKHFFWAAILFLLPIFVNPLAFCSERWLNHIFYLHFNVNAIKLLN